MSSIVSNEFIKTEIGFYSDSVKDKTEHLLRHCYSLLVRMGDIRIMTPHTVEYIVGAEASKMYSSDEELDFVVRLTVGLIGKYVHCGVLVKIETPQVEAPKPVVRSPNPMVAAIMGSSKKKSQKQSIPPGFEHVRILKRPTQPEESKLEILEPEPLAEVQNSQKTSYCSAARAAGVDEVSDVSESHEIEKKKPHFFSYVDEDTGVVDPEIVDRYLPEEGDRACFITSGISEDEVVKYLYKFPRVEYYSTYKENEDGNFIVKITFNGLSSAERIHSLISSKLEERDYFDILTTHSEDSFMLNLGDTSQYFIRSKVIDDRLTSIRFFKFVKKEFVYPTKKSLEEQFKLNSSGKVPIALVYNMPLETFNTLSNGRILGYKFILTKTQPEDVNLRSLMVFKTNTK